MARKPRTIGKYELPPKLPMSEAVQIAKTVVSGFKESEFSDDALAAKLGHAATKSGAFRQKIADLRRYGLIDGRGSSLHASPTAQAIYADRPGEVGGALKDMMFSVPLFKDLYERHGVDALDGGDAVPNLLNITNAPRPEVERDVGMLRELYRDACGTIPAMPGSARSAPPPGPSFRGSDAGGSGLNGDRFASRTADYEFSVADDAETIESVIEQLQARKKSLERQRPGQHTGSPKPA